MADKEEKSVVDTAKERYERAKDAYGPSRVLAIADTQFAMGDSDNGWQWPDAIRNSRVLEKKVCLTVNATAQHCNQIINNMRQNRPQCRVMPVDSGADKKTAEILAGLIRNIQTASNADDAHDTAAEHSTYGGEGYWRIITEYESEKSFNQVIKIKPVPNPLLVLIDPAAKEMDKSDAAWGFIFEDISKEECKRDHPDVDPASWQEDPRGWVSADSVRRAEYFYCEYTADTSLLLADGNFVLKSELGKGEYAGLTYEDMKAAGIITKERATTIKKWKWCKLLGGHDKPLDAKDWAGSYLPIVAVVGKELNVNGEIVRKGVVRDLKDPARMLNFSYSEAVQTVALQNKVPYIAAVESMEGYEDIWRSANTSNLGSLPWNAFDAQGRPLPKPERQEPAVMPSAQVQMLQLSTEQMRAASGQQNANFGIKSEAVSGVGIQRLKAQGEIATFHFPDNQVRGLRYEAKILIDLIQKIYDTKRVVRILGMDGKEEKATLDPDMQKSYHEDTTEEDIQKIFNPMVGVYDVVIDTGPSYQTQRQEAAAALTELAGKNPIIMTAAPDIVMRAYDFPMADQLAKRLEKTIPPELQDKKGNEKVPPQVQAAMQQQSQQIEQMSAALENAHAEVQQLEAEKESRDREFALKERELAMKERDSEAALMRPEQVDQEMSDPALVKAQGDIDVARINAESAERIKMIEVAGQVMVANQANEVDEGSSDNEPDDQSATALAVTIEAIQQLVATMAAPKRVIYNDQGRVAGVETFQG